MATSKKLAEQIEAAEREVKQQENRIKELKQQHKTQESKERTHRLIERGAILESLVEGAATLTNEQVKGFLIKTLQTEFARKILTQFKSENSKDTGKSAETTEETASVG